MGRKADPLNGACPEANTRSPILLDPFGLVLSVLGQEFFDYLRSKKSNNGTSQSNREGDESFVVPDVAVACPDDIEDRGHGERGINETRPSQISIHRVIGWMNTSGFGICLVSRLLPNNHLFNSPRMPFRYIVGKTSLG